MTEEELKAKKEADDKAKAEADAAADTGDGKVNYDDIYDKGFEEIIADGADKGDAGDKKEEDKADDKSGDEGDKPKEGDENKDDKKDEVKLEEKPAAPPTDKKDDTPAAPVIDTEKIVKEVSDQVSKNLEEKFGKQQTEEQKDELAEALKAAPWVAEKRNPTYAEVIKWTAEHTAKVVKAQVMEDLNKEVQEEETKEEEAKKAQTANIEAWNTYWDTQFEELEKAGKIPPIKNKEDLNDPGRKVRLKLFQTMASVTEERKAKGLAPVTSLVETFAMHYKEEDKQPAGADAPVAGTTKSTTGSESENYNYDEIRNASFEDIITGKV